MSCQYCPGSRVVTWKRKIKSDKHHHKPRVRNVPLLKICSVFWTHFWTRNILMYTLKYRDRKTVTGVVSSMSPLTVVRVVPYNVVSSTPVPQKKSGISGAWHDVAVSSDVGLWPGQTRHDIPVAKNYLGQLSCGEEGGRRISQCVPLTLILLKAMAA